MLRWKLICLETKLIFTFNKIFYHYPKCSVCHHPLFDHVLYDEAHTRSGVCVNPCCIDSDLNGTTRCDSWNTPLQISDEVMKA